MTIGLPIVVSLKCFNSPGKCQGSSPFSPIALLRAIAAIIVIFLPLRILKDSSLQCV